jgi:TonB family protein
MSERAAEAVVGSRGPLHPAGDTVGDRVAQVLKRGSGEMAVGRSGFWDAYFTVLRKALMTAWPAEQSRTWTDQKRSTRIRLVIDAEGLVRDFEVIIVSGDRVMDREVEQVLHACAQLPPPPPGVMQGKTELVTEWQLTVHPGLAAKQGSYGFGYGSGITFGAVFDMVTLFDPHIDLTPLERNVTLASYWTR